MAEQSTPNPKCIENEVYNDSFFKIRSSTQNKVVKLRHTWTTHNFSFCSEKNGEFLTSPTFSPRKNQWDDKSEWCLELYPKGEDEDSSDFVSVYLVLVTSNLNKIQTEFALGIVNANGEDTNIVHNSSKNIVVEEEWGCNDFVRQDFLLNQKNMMLLDDNLTVYCEITAIVGIENISETVTTSKCDLSKELQVSKYYENEYDDPIFKSTSSTLIKVVKFRHTWTVNSFSRNWEKIGEKLISPAFSAGKNRWNDKMEWCLKLYLTGKAKEGSEYVSLYLMLNSCHVGEILTKYKLGILNADGKDFQKVDASHRFTKNKTSSGFKKFIKWNDLHNQESKFVVDDKLNIFCEITATACSNTSEILTTPQNDLPKGFDFLFENSELSDITLSACGKEFSAHK